MNFQEKYYTLSLNLKTPLIDSIIEGDFLKFSEIIKNKPESVYETDSFGRNPLMCAVLLDRKVLYELLLKETKDLNLKSSSGNTVLDICVRFKKDCIKEVAETFAKHKLYQELSDASSLAVKLGISDYSEMLQQIMYTSKFERKEK